MSRISKTKLGKMVYVITDTRNERAEGKPSYVAETSGTTATHDIQRAAVFTSKAAAARRAKEWVRAMEYATDHWVSVRSVYRFASGVIS